MAPRKRPIDRIPDFVRCMNCRNEIYTASYQGLPNPQTPRELVHRSYGHPYYAGVHCAACGHYSVFQPKGFEPPKGGAES